MIMRKKIEGKEDKLRSSNSSSNRDKVYSVTFKITLILDD